MALEGNLTAFGLSEILQLIAVQQKTGMLTITNHDTTTVMFFRGGEVVSTRDRRRKARDSFRDYLTRYGVLEQDSLARVSQISTQSKLDLVDVLSSENLFTSDELLKHWRNQIQETMHDVLTWEEGSYKFVTSSDLVDGIRSPASFSVEAMLMESMRRIDEFPQMLEMFPSEKIVFSRSNDAGDTQMTSNEKFVLGLLDRPAALVDLIGRGRMPVFEVYEALKNLRDKGLIDMEEPAPADDEPAAGPDRAERRRVIKNVFPVIVAFALFCGAMYVGFGEAATSLSPQQVLDARIMAGEPDVRAHAEHRLRWLIEAYRADTGHYPATLGQLSESRLAAPSFMKEARAHEFRYRLTGGGSSYTLL